jgi:hypothetical protein
MECECGKEMKEIDSQFGRDYCQLTYYCGACDAFYKDESIKIDRISKIEEAEELENCRALLERDE